MADIQVDPERAREYLEQVAAHAEAADFAADAKSERARAAMESADSDPAAWSTVADRSVAALADHVCPAWNLSDDERQMTSSALAAALDEWFPGAVHGFDNWSPTTRLFGVLVVLAIPRFDLARLRFRPLQSKREGSDADDSESAGWEPVLDDGDDQVGQDAAHVTIGTGG